MVKIDPDIKTIDTSIAIEYLQSINHTDNYDDDLIGAVLLLTDRYYQHQIEVLEGKQVATEREMERMQYYRETYRAGLKELIG